MSLDASLQALLDKQAIAEVMMRYCRALDHCDVELLRSVFHHDSKHHHFFRGPSSLPEAEGKAGDPLAPPQAWDTEMDVWVGGRYLDRMEKRDGEWRITHRTGTTDWQRIEPPSSTGFGDLTDQESMRQDRSDLVYRRREVYR